MEDKELKKNEKGLYINENGMLFALAFPGAYYDRKTGEFNFGDFDFNNIENVSEKVQKERISKLFKQMDEDEPIYHI